MIYNAIMNRVILSKAEKKELEGFYKKFPRAIIFVENGKVCFSQKYVKNDRTSDLLFTGYVYGALAEILKVLVENRQIELEFLVGRYC